MLANQNLHIRGCTLVPHYELIQKKEVVEKQNTLSVRNTSATSCSLQAWLIKRIIIIQVT